MRVFIDLDGVLADFDKGATSLFGVSPRDFEALHGVRAFWKRLADAPGYYEGLEWMPGGRALWQFAVASLAPALPMILTGLPLGQWAEPQKRAWCARELGAEIPVLCCMSVDKHKFCSEGDVLIDDRASAGIDWATAGGRFVLFTNAPLAIADLSAILAEQASHEGE